MAPFCHGNNPDHCCHLGEYGVCEYLEEYTVPGRRWACGLFRELGSWEAVYADARYRGSEAKRFMDRVFPGFGCGDWPQNIPGRLEEGGYGLCCWREVSDGNVG